MAQGGLGGTGELWLAPEVAQEGNPFGALAGLEKEQGSSACVSPGSLSLVSPSAWVFQEPLCLQPWCWAVLGAAGQWEEGGQLQGTATVTGVARGHNMSWGVGCEVYLKQSLQPILTSPSSVEVAWLEAEGRWEVWWDVPFMLVEEKRVCVGTGTEQSPALETQENVFLAKDKYTGVFPLITQRSIILE